MQLLKSIDQFGVDRKQKEFTSSIGGIFTVITYGLCIIVGIIIISKRNINYISMQYQSDLTNFEMNSSIIRMQINSNNNSNNNVNPFNTRNMMIIPLLNSELLEYTNDGTILFSKSKFSSNDRLLLQIIRCDQKYLSEGMQCADEKNINKFLNEGNSVTLQIELNYFNISTQKLQNYKNIQTIDVIFSANLIKLYQLELYVKQITLDNGLLFENIQQYNQISDIRIQQELVENNNNKIVSEFEIKCLDRMEITLINYPKLNELLQQIGIISLIIIIVMGKIMRQINNQLQQDNDIMKIISYYYPQYKQIKIVSNIFGSKRRVYCQGNQVDLQQFDQFYQRCKKYALKKLNIRHMIYEISRLQFAIQSMQDRGTLMNVHRVGIKLQLNNFDMTETQYNITQLNEIDDVSYLIESDMYLLCRNKQQQNITFSNNLFYKNNMINNNNII